MSIETIATHINFYEEPQANRPQFIEDEPAAIEESPQERRLRLHYELAALTVSIHELQTRHHTLTLGLIETVDKQAHTPLPSRRKARSKMTERKRLALQSRHRELQLIRDTLPQEQAELAKEIHHKRHHQGQLIADTAIANTQIWRPPYDDGDFGHTGRTNKQVRADLEAPVSKAMHNGGEDPRDLTTPSRDGEPHGPTYRYLQNAAQ